MLCDINGTKNPKSITIKSQKCYSFAPKLQLKLGISVLKMVKESGKMPHNI